MTLVASVKHTADGGHDAEDGLDEVGVGHDDTFGNSSAAAGVHDDGRVRGIRWGFSLCGGRAGRENGGELVEGDRLGIGRQKLRLVAEIMKVSLDLKLSLSIVSEIFGKRLAHLQTLFGYWHWLEDVYNG